MKHGERIIHDNIKYKFFELSQWCRWRSLFFGNLAPCHCVIGAQHLENVSKENDIFILGDETTTMSRNIGQWRNATSQKHADRNTNVPCKLSVMVIQEFTF